MALIMFFSLNAHALATPAEYDKLISDLVNSVGFASCLVGYKYSFEESTIDRSKDLDKLMTEFCTVYAKKLGEQALGIK